MYNGVLESPVVHYEKDSLSPTSSKEHAEDGIIIIDDFSPNPEIYDHNKVDRRPRPQIEGEYEDDDSDESNGPHNSCFHSCLRKFRIIKSSGHWNKPCLALIAEFFFILIVIIVVLALRDISARKHELQKHGNEQKPPPVYNDTSTPIVAAGSYHSCSVSKSKLFCWGKNDVGQLGDGTKENSMNAKLIEGVGRVRQISLGRHNTCAIDVHDKLFCWGQNLYGEIGDGSTTDSMTPVRVYMPNDEKVEVVAVGYYHTCAILKNNTRLMCWGRNMHGRLGDGTILDKNYPSRTFEGDKIVTQVSLGRQHTCAVTDFGKKLYCWGHNSFGQVGDGETTRTHLSPKNIIDFTNTENKIVQISLGRFHSCALLYFHDEKRNVLKCWGFNKSGQVGDGTHNDETGRDGDMTQNQVITPTVIAIDDVARVDCGDFHTCAIKKDGSLFCWGQNLDGRLGDGTLTERLEPTHIPMPVNKTVIDIASGGLHTCAILNSERMKCWGTNYDGQLGDGTTISRINATQLFSG